MTVAGRYITDEDLQDALGPDAYLRVFDRDGDGTADDAALTRAIGAAENRIDSKLKASHDTPFTGTIPDFVKTLAVELAPWEAVKFWPANGTEMAPYRTLWKDAIAQLEDLAKDRVARLPTAIAEPIASASSYVSAPTPLFAAAANSQDADPDGTSVLGNGGKYSGF